MQWHTTNWHQSVYHSRQLASTQPAEYGWLINHMKAFICWNEAYARDIMKVTENHITDHNKESVSG